MRRPGMNRQRPYVGLTEDLKTSGLSPSAKIILDAKVFDLIAQDEECKGWRQEGVSALYAEVSDAWEKHGFLPSKLPEELQKKHKKLFDEAMKIARENGWDPDAELENG